MPETVSDLNKTRFGNVKTGLGDLRTASVLGNALYGPNADSISCPALLPVWFSGPLRQMSTTLARGEREKSPEQNDSSKINKPSKILKPPRPNATFFLPLKNKEFGEPDVPFLGLWIIPRWLLCLIYSAMWCGQIQAGAPSCQAGGSWSWSPCGRAAPCPPTGPAALYGLKLPTE